MKTLLRSITLIVIASAAVVFIPKTADAGLTLNCGFESVYRYHCTQQQDGNVVCGWGFVQEYQCKWVWVCMPYNC